jgi:hypothetical protein
VGLYPTMVQILVLAPFHRFIPGFFRCQWWLRESAGARSFRGAHRGKIGVHVFIVLNVRACCERLRNLKFFIWIFIFEKEQKIYKKIRIPDRGTAISG